MRTSTSIELNPFAEKILQFYPYRTAVVASWAIKIRLSDEDLEELREYVKEQGYELDNHTCFTTEWGAFWYSDHNLYVGKTVTEGRY